MCSGSKDPSSVKSTKAPWRSMGPARLATVSEGELRSAGLRGPSGLISLVSKSCDPGNVTWLKWVGNVVLGITGRIKVLKAALWDMDGLTSSQNWAQAATAWTGGKQLAAGEIHE